MCYKQQSGEKKLKYACRKSHKGWEGCKFRGECWVISVSQSNLGNSQVVITLRSQYDDARYYCWIANVSIINMVSIMYKLTELLALLWIVIVKSNAVLFSSTVLGFQTAISKPTQITLKAYAWLEKSGIKHICKGNVSKTNTFHKKMHF